MEPGRARNREKRQVLQLDGKASGKNKDNFQLLFHPGLVQNISYAVIGIDPAGRIVTWNSAAEELYGWKEQEAVGNILEELIHTKYPLDREIWVKILVTKGSWQGEIRQQKRSGDWIDVQASMASIIDVEGKVTGTVGILRDITESNALARELQERDQQLQAAIDIARLGIWKITLATRQAYCSPTNKIHLGFAPDEQIDYDSIREKLFPEASEKQGQDVQEILQTKGAYETEYQVTWPNGSVHWIAVSGQAQYGEDGVLASITGVTFDITRRKMEEQRKDTFIGIASHELKTPLTTVKGFTQLLKRQLRRLGMGDQITTLNKMEEQINSLNRLVSELLDITKIQAGKLEYVWTEVDIDKLVKNVVEMCQQGCKHRIKVSGTAGRTIMGDQARLEQVFSNLINNAVKYSPLASRVDIWLKGTSERVTVKIRDYGIGMPPGEIEHIFERFYRVGAEKHKAIDGLGMGLYIAQEIVGQHGGKIRVESKEETGSTFYVELPCSLKPEEKIG